MSYRTREIMPSIVTLYAISITLVFVLLTVSETDVIKGKVFKVGDSTYQCKPINTLKYEGKE